MAKNIKPTGQNTPLVSVVMSVYNCENYVAEAIDSILAQTFENFEFIIINDGSTDDTLKLVKKYKDPRIVLISRENKGLVASLNEGIARARGKYIARQDGDDASSPARLEKQVARFKEDAGLSLVSTAFDMFTDSPSTPVDVQLLPFKDRELRLALGLKNPFGHGSCMFSLDAYKRAGGYREKDTVEDYDLWIRLAREGALYQIPEVLYHWRVLSGGITHEKGVEQAAAAAKLRTDLVVENTSSYSEVAATYKEYAEWVSKNGYPVLLDSFLEHLRGTARRLLRTGQVRKWLKAQLIYRKLTAAHYKHKRVLVVRNAFRHDFGGAETYALNLSKTLASNSYYPLLATKVPGLIEKARSNGLAVLPSRWNDAQGWSKFYMIRGIRTLAWYVVQIFKYRIDILHLQSRDDFIFGTIAATICFKRVVWTDHGDLKYILRKSSPKSLVWSILLLAKKAKSVIAVSESEKSEIEAEYRLNNIQVVYNGVIAPKVITSADKPGGLTVIGAVSRMVDTKGIRELLRGFALLKNKKTVLWLVGDGPDITSYKNLAKEMGIDKRVIFFGQRSDVWSYLASIDVYVFPTYHEAFSLSLIEAVVSGLPIICTDVGGNAEIASRVNSILIPPKDVDAITSAIERVIADPQEYTPDTELVERLKSEFNFERIVRKKVIPAYER